MRYQLNFTSLISGIRLGLFAALLTFAPAMMAFANGFEAAGVQPEGAIHFRGITLSPTTLVPVTPVTVIPVLIGDKMTQLAINCPATLVAHKSATCNATVVYANGVKKTINPTSGWSVLGVNAKWENVATMSGNTLTATGVANGGEAWVELTYTEGGVTLTARAVVNIMTANFEMTALKVNCPATVISNGLVKTCDVTAVSNFTNAVKFPTTGWASSNTVALSMSGATLVPHDVTVDTPVTVYNTYSEGGVTLTGSTVVTVKANTTLVTLTALTINCPATVSAGSTTPCTARTSYSDGTSKSATPATGWDTDNHAVATVLLTPNGDMSLIAVNSLTSDTPVSVSLTVTENGVTKTATAIVTVKAPTQTANQSACSGTAASLGGITIIGNANKKVGIDALEVDYCLKNFDAATRYDVYVAVQLPDNSLLWLQSQGGMGTTFSTAVAPYLASALIKDQNGVLTSMPVIPATLPKGTFGFYMAAVLPGKDIMNLLNLVGNLAKAQVTLTQ